MALDLTDRAAVLEYLTDQLPTEDEGALEALLDASAGTTTSDPPVTTYRPWWVIGNVLQSNASAMESVTSAAGSSVTYRDPVTAIRALMRRQAAFDATLTVPAGFEATAGGTGSARLVRSYG